MLEAARGRGGAAVLGHPAIFLLETADELSTERPICGKFLRFRPRYVFFGTAVRPDMKKTSGPGGPKTRKRCLANGTRPARGSVGSQGKG